MPPWLPLLNAILSSPLSLRTSLLTPPSMTSGAIPRGEFTVRTGNHKNKETFTNKRHNRKFAEIYYQLTFSCIGNNEKHVLFCVGKIALPAANRMARRGSVLQGKGILNSGGRASGFLSCALSTAGNRSGAPWWLDWLARRPAGGARNGYAQVWWPRLSLQFEALQTVGG